MNILVCISKAPDTTSKIAFTDGDTKFDENGVQFIVNPYDEWYALVRALELKEANGGTVTTITVGGADNDAVIRKALAIGADKAVRVDADPSDPMYVAKQIANYASNGDFNMIFTGKETINYNGSILGGMIAELLDWPYASLASKLEINGDTATVELEAQGGIEVVEITGSFVLSAAKGMAEQRIPNMRGIMMARKKPLEVIPASEASTHTSVKNYELPPAKGECKYIDADNAGELIELLRNEAKVI